MSAWQVCGRPLRVDHVEKYRLPKKLQEQEEAKEIQSRKFGPGHAYQDKELANQYNLEQGHDLFAPPPSPQHPPNGGERAEDEDIDSGRREKKHRHKSEKKKKKHKNEERKRHHKDSRRDQDERKRQKRARKMREGSGEDRDTSDESDRKRRKRKSH